MILRLSVAVYDILLMSEHFLYFDLGINALLEITIFGIVFYLFKSVFLLFIIDC